MLGALGKSKLSELVYDSWAAGLSWWPNVRMGVNTLYSLVFSSLDVFYWPSCMLKESKPLIEHNCLSKVHQWKHCSFGLWKCLVSEKLNLEMVAQL